MNLFNKHKQKRGKYWQEVEDYFNCLPPQLYKQGVLLRNKLAIQFSETGHFSDILARAENYPPLNMAFWLHDDFNCPEGKARSKYEEHLFLGDFFIFATIYAQNLILDEDLYFDRDYLLLTSLSSQEADRHFSHLFPADSIFWEYHRNLWQAYAEVKLVSWENYSDRTVVVTPEHILQRVDLLAPYKLIPIAVAILSGRENDVDKLITTMGRLHILQMILHDMANLHVDLQHAKFTYPILTTYEELGIPMEKEYTPESMLLAMTLIGSFSKLAEECQTLIDSCLAGASELKLSNLNAYFSALKEIVNDRINEYSRMELPVDEIEGAQVEAISSKPVPTFEKDFLLRALNMAAGYLLSDLTFKESWEVHRWGMVDESVVTSRFPAGLIIETLCMSGQDLTEQVEKFFRYTKDNNFSYYDHKQLPYADSDTLGVLLRLYGYSANRDANQETLETPLAWMRLSVEESGRIPVWIRRGMHEIEVNDSRPVRLLGEGCGSIEAKLLIGLCDYDWDTYQDIIHASAMQLLKRFIEHGSGITVNYPRLYCSWRIKQLLSCLGTQPVKKELEACLEEANKFFPENLILEANQYRITPQQAAFLILASLDSPADHLFNHNWVSTLLSNQRSNGSWYGEPLFFEPNLGKYTTWHSSHQLTTAFCYRALKVYAHSV